MKKEEQYRKTMGGVQPNRREVMRRPVQGASVRVPSPLARPASPLEKQRAERGATLVRYQPNSIWQALENQCGSMKCSIMSKRTGSLCDPSPRSRVRHSHSAGITRTKKRQDDDDLYACAQSGWSRGQSHQTYWRRRADWDLSSADGLAYDISRTDIGLGLTNGYWIRSQVSRVY